MSNRGESMNKVKIDQRFEQIPLERIDPLEKGFSIAFPQETDEVLMKSIRDYGVMVPVVLQERPGRLFRIVSGHRRIHALLAMGAISVPARIVDSDIQDKELFLLNVRENAITRSLNDIERALIMHRLCSEFGGGDEDVLQVMPLLGLAPSKRVRDQYVRLVRLMPDLQRYMVAHSIPVRASSRLGDWYAEDQAALSSLLDKIRLGGRMMQEVLDLLEEISLRDHTRIADLLGRMDIRAMIEDDQCTSTQKRERLRKRLTQIRYPTLTERTDKITQFLKAAGSPAGVSIKLPSYLEGNSLQVSFSFRSVRELEEKRGELGVLARKREIQEVLRHLNLETEE
jgi:hypothetical protein